MTDIIVVGLLLIIIFILISAFAPEVFIYGTLFLCIIFFVITAVLGINSFINDPIGSLWWAVDHNPVISMADSMSPIQMPPVDPKEWRVLSVSTYIFGIGVIGYACYNLFSGWRSERRKCEE